jgi:membrane associated rhomboid family serine protease
MMLPVQDLNPDRRFPIATYALIALNAIVFIWELSLGDAQLQQAFNQIAAIPASISRAPFATENLLDIVRSMFLHGGWEHILGNMLYLWLFGDNVEDRFGSLLYVALYFIGGFAAAYAQTLIDPSSNVPMIGASGAIAAVLGSYIVLYPGVRVRAIVPLGGYSRMSELPAWVVLGFWFVLQVFNGVASLGATADTGGVAVFAHIGGFIVGAVLTFVFMMLVPQPPAEDRNQMLYNRSRRSF